MAASAHSLVQETATSTSSGSEDQRGKGRNQTSDLHLSDLKGHSNKINFFSTNYLSTFDSCKIHVDLVIRFFLSQYD